MRRLIGLGIALIILVVVGFAVAGESHQMGGSMPMASQSEAQEQPSGQHRMMGGGMRGHGMMGQGMMGMMCPMMALMMDPSGMGMMAGQQMDAKAIGHMLQLRGDILKAIGEVLLKHGKAMEEAQ
jgi:hypothetical protein